MKAHQRQRVAVRVFVVVLLAAVMALIIWHPWQDNRNDRYIDVNGKSTITVEPDELVFRPSYEFKSTNREDALNTADKKREELISKLKALGVAEQNIKTNMTSIERPLRDGVNDETTYIVIFAITASGQELDRKVQDYLATTTPVSSPMPYFQLSKQKQLELESQARTKAVEDARAKAEQSARSAGFRTGEVRRVDDGFAFGFPADWGAIDTSTKYSTVLHAGKNEVTYTMVISFYLK